ncbi:class I histocompatibility antigen, F10 alpha chain-like [Mauremys reevesii]|uniref:class I histocompatibility antigen, F10 alpha chain-like n=1 Tax=Mauremys reevesii TaxID=260615 RepID=UPI00193F6745|nr:class I histocompatibility antigen, F10 alpha chain-like [Mauremys reevesii]
MTSSLGLRPDWTGPGSCDTSERESESAGTALVTPIVRVSARGTAGRGSPHVRIFGALSHRGAYCPPPPGPMAWGLLLALCGALLAPAAAGGRHSLGVLVTAIIQEDGTHHFIMIAQLDDVQIAYYSSDRREVRPTQTWAEQAVGAEYLQEKTRDFWGYEEETKVETRSWMQLHNQTSGVHTEQLHVTCALSGQAPVDPRFQYAYDGRDFISFDAQTGTWVAAVQPAFLQKQSWETGKTWTQYVQHYLQSECLGTLRSLVQRGRAVLEQQVSPEVSVSRRDTPDGSVTLSCHARGFYPRPIHVSWVRDGEDILAETDSSGILPNADGTYYTQSSLEISPQQEDGHRYACRVEHSSQGEPVLVWAPGKKGPLSPGVLAAIVLAVLVLAGAVGAGVILWRRKSAGPMKPGYAPAASE